MFRRGLTEVQWFGWDVVFSITLWMPASFLFLPNLGDEFFFETLFCSLRFANNHMLCQRIVFGEQEYSCTLWRWRAYDFGSWVGHDFSTPDFATLGISISSSRENHISHTKMSDAQNMEVHKRWTTSASEVQGIVGFKKRKIWSFAVCVLWGSLRAVGEHILRIFSSYSQSVNFRHYVMIWEFDFCSNAFILIFWGSLEKFTTSVFKERQTETVRASFAKGSSLCPQSNQDGRGRTNIRRSGWSIL